MITEETLKEIVWRVHLVPELSGCIVGFYGNGICRVIGFPSCTTPNSENVAVIVEEVVVPGVPTATGKIVEITHAEAQQIVRNRWRLGPELIGAGVSCSLTAASAFGVIGGVAGYALAGPRVRHRAQRAPAGRVSGMRRAATGAEASPPRGAPAATPWA